MKPSGPEMELRVAGISALVENLILLEYMTVGAALRRLVLIVKQRASSHDLSAREFQLSSNGIVVADNADTASDLVAASDRLGAHHARHRPLPEGK